MWKCKSNILLLQKNPEMKRLSFTYSALHVKVSSTEIKSCSKLSREGRRKSEDGHFGNERREKDGEVIHLEELNKKLGRHFSQQDIFSIN